MISFPNCKINLGLWITERLPDGYHHLQTIMYPVPWRDILEIIPTNGSTLLSLSGIAIEGPMEQNLCFRAWQLMKDRHDISAVQMHLHKVIPAGAGLGGGSADAAFVLMQLNSLFSLNLPQSVLAQYAAKLGMDCPFFIYNQPMLATSKGEMLEGVHLTLDGYYIVIVRPNLHISTAKAYAMVTPRHRNTSLGELIAQPPEYWKKLLVNDFEESIISAFPQIGRIKQSLYSCGAIYASMSGSGSAVFGLFRHKPAEFQFAECEIFTTLLGSDF